MTRISPPVVARALLVLVAAASVTFVAGTARPARAASSSLRIEAIGDSVMAAVPLYGAAPVVTGPYPGTTFDAFVCRRLIAPSCTYQGVTPPTALSVFQANRGNLGDIVVIGVGYNDTLTASTVDTIMNELVGHGVQAVVWLNYRNASGVYSGPNAALAAAPARWAQLHVADWDGHAAAHGEWFAGSEVHLTGSGALAYAAFIKLQLDLVANLVGPCPASDNAQVSGSAPAQRPPGRGYWLLDSQGRVWGFGPGHAPTPNLGDLTTAGDVTPPASFQSTPTGEGYWIVDQNGRVFAFGDAVNQFYGDMTGHVLNGPVRRIEPNPSGGGYWLVASDGGVFSFGPSTAFYGSEGGAVLNAPIISMHATATGRGYWLVAGDGGVFSFGDARFHGSEGGAALNGPVISMAASPTGAGYWLYARDGGVFSFDVPFYGSEPQLGSCGDAPVAMRPTNTGAGYWLATAAGRVYGFGDAITFGDRPALPSGTTIVDMAIRH